MIIWKLKVGNLPYFGDHNIAFPSIILRIFTLFIAQHIITIVIYVQSKIYRYIQFALTKKHFSEATFKGKCDYLIIQFTFDIYV